MKKSLIHTSLVACSFLACASITYGVNAKEESGNDLLLDVAAKIQDAKKEKEKETRVYRQEVKELLEKKGGIIGIKELPIRKLYFVEAEQGTYLVSPDARFVIDGSIKDVWHRKTLRTLSDLDGLDRVPVTSNAPNIEDSLATFQLGNKQMARSGVIFVDPTSEYTMTALKKIESLKDTQNWTVVLMPVIGGSQALDRSRKLWCAEDKSAALQDLINGTNTSFDKLRKECKEDRFINAQLITNVFGIESLPHLIREDGLISRGFPLEFDKWYKQP